ncbi:MAG: hypothetical protein WC869_03440 [Phycisphaerae bacterium]|jgi:uncharacterized membrane protein
MKTTLLIVMALAVTVALGCESPRGGGMSGGEGFKIGTPTFTTQVKQGETESVTISVNRGKYFKRDVTLEINASKGISVEPTQATVKGNETPDVHLRITAAKDADLGEYKVYVKGTPESGEATSTEITVKVVSP